MRSAAMNTRLSWALIFCETGLRKHKRRTYCSAGNCPLGRVVEVRWVADGIPGS